MRPICVLVGPPGAGKTTVGEFVAAKLGVAFRDTDADVVALAGKPISDIFIDDGEARFREMESAALIAALAGCDGVLALGGGAVMSERNRARLTGHTVVFLSVGLAAAIKRTGLGSGRPLLSVNPRATLRFLLEERRPRYDQVATHTVETDGREPEDIAGEVLSLLSDRDPR